MNKYENGKIYRIDPLNPQDIGDVYIGSTTRMLESRMAEHIYNYQYFLKNEKNHSTRSVKLFQKYGIETCRITLIESFSCNSRKELQEKEASYINTINCVNKQFNKQFKTPYLNMNPNIKKRLCCFDCNYFTDSKSNLNKHLISNKHILRDKKIVDADCKFKCEKCNKFYKGQSGLWKHNKLCKLPDNTLLKTSVVAQTQTIPELSNKIDELTKKIDELTKKIDELTKNQQPSVL